jgi:hypothetical protein
MKKFYIIMLLMYWVQHVCAQANQTLSNLTSPTSVNVTLLPKNDNKINLGSVNKSWKNIYLDSSLYLGGNRFLTYATGTGNTAVGSAALNANTTGVFNTAAGSQSLYSNIGGAGNTANGYDALYSNTIGQYNTANGLYSLYSNINGTGNTASGDRALYSNTTGNFNTASGWNTLSLNTSGAWNTANGYNALSSNTTGYSNVAIGSNALFRNTTGHNLVAVGDSALYNQSVNGSDSYYNTAIGSRALFSNTTGFNNTASGVQALYSNTGGAYNTANGVHALYSNTTGNYNTANGLYALYSNTTGYSNTAGGFYALYSNTTAYGNTANGLYTLYSDTTGNDNTADGEDALYANTTGSGNTANGVDALNSNTTGTRNTAIGLSANVSASNLNNATAIGYAAVVDGSNKVHIGNTTVTSIGGLVGWTTFSDGSYKKNIKEDVQGLAFINNLRPITYTVDVTGLNAYYNKGRKNIEDNRDVKEKEAMQQATDEAGKIIYNGFVAQEVEATAQRLNYNFSGVDKPKEKDGLYGLRYSDFVVPLVKAVQELSKMNDDKDAKINDLQNQINELKAMIVANRSEVNGHQSTDNSQVLATNFSAASLQQNIPNPFNHTTTISYSLLNQFSSAQIIITDKNGNQLKQFNLSGAGRGTITVDASTLASGAYNYSLYVDGTLVTTRQMTLIK